MTDEHFGAWWPAVLGGTKKISASVRLLSIAYAHFERGRRHTFGKMYAAGIRRRGLLTGAHSSFPGTPPKGRNPGANACKKKVVGGRGTKSKLWWVKPELTYWNTHDAVNVMTRVEEYIGNANGRQKRVLSCVPERLIAKRIWQNESTIIAK